MESLLVEICISSHCDSIISFAQNQPQSVVPRLEMGMASTQRDLPKMSRDSNESSSPGSSSAKPLVTMPPDDISEELLPEEKCGYSNYSSSNVLINVCSIRIVKFIRLFTVTWQEKLTKYWDIAKTLVCSMLVSATAKLHSFSGGYREVAKLLEKDKELVKQRYPDGLAILTEEYRNRSSRAPIYKPSTSEGLAQVKTLSS